MKIKLSDYVFQFIASKGVKHVFMFPGGGAMHLVDSLGNCKELNYICNLHEQACSIAAEAYSKVTNNFGAALVTTGPGGTNAITGVVAAWLDSTPCMIISGQVKRSDLKGLTRVRQLGVQEVDIVSIVKSFTKYAVTILEPNEIRYHLEKAYFLANHCRPGPVWIDIPLDVQASEVEIDECPEFNPSEFHDAINQKIPENWINYTIELLNNCERPVILAGNGIRLSKGSSAFLTFIDHLQFPVLTTWLGMDLISESHELFIGRPGSIAPRGANFALQNADLLLSIGARLDMAMVGYSYQNLSRGAKKIIVDIDPHEISKIDTKVDLPLVIDAKFFIDQILKEEKKLKKKDRSKWILRCREWKEKYPVVTNNYYLKEKPISMYAFSEILSNELSEKDIISPGSSGNALETFLLVFKTKPGQRIFHARGLGSMGFGLPASIGACLGSGGKRTICVDGDGGFQLNIQELETVSRLKLPIKFFVINNNGFASIRAMEYNYFGKLTACDSTSGLTLPDIVRVASAYNLNAVSISKLYELREQIKKVLDFDGPVVCEVVVTPDEVRAPRISSKKIADGSMVSSPLEDLWPFLDRDEFLSNMIIPPLSE